MKQTVEQLHKQLRDVSERIEDLAMFQYELPSSYYRSKLGDLYERKRAVLAMLSGLAYRPWGAMR
jgi:hypothetical protein